MKSWTLLDSDQSVEKAIVLRTACLRRATRKVDPLYADNTAGKQRERSVGTAHAISIFSVASSPARRWGGSRNSASRTSDSLSLSQATNILEAAQFAAAAGMPFNRHLTIHWQQAGIPDERAAWATGRFLKMAGDWLNKQGKTLAWAWVRENGERKGSHAHILLHLTAGTQIGRMQRRWLRLITGKPYIASTIKTVRIGGTAGAARSTPALYDANLRAVIEYLLKGTNRRAAAALGLTRLEVGGWIIGKRSATSQNVGRKARNEATR